MKRFLILLLCGFTTACSVQVNEAKTRQILGQLSMAIHLYEGEFGKLDVADPDHVFSELAAGNRKKMMIISPIDAERERRAFLDAWNHPVRFSRLADGSLQITSAGADGRFGSTRNDDISLK